MIVSVCGLTLVSTTYSNVLDPILKLISVVAERKKFDYALRAYRLDIH